MNSSINKENGEGSSARNTQPRPVGESNSNNTGEPGCSPNNLNAALEDGVANNNTAQTDQSQSPQIVEPEPSTSNLLFRMSGSVDLREEVSTMYLTQSPEEDTLELPLAVDREDSDGSIVLIYNNEQAPHHSDMDLHSNSNESLLLGGLGELNGLRRMNGLRQFNDSELNSGSFVSLVRESGSSNYIDLLDQESGDGLHVSSSDNLLVPNPPNEGWNEYSWNNRHEIHGSAPEQAEGELNRATVYIGGENNEQVPNEVPNVEPIDQQSGENQPGVSGEAAPLEASGYGPSTSNANHNGNHVYKGRFSCLSYGKAMIGALRCRSGTNVLAFREAIWSYLMDFSVYEDDGRIEIPWLRDFKSELGLSTLDAEDSDSSDSDTDSDSPIVEVLRTISEPALNPDARRVLQQKLTKRSSNNIDIPHLLDTIEQGMLNSDHQHCSECTNMLRDFVRQLRKESHTDSDEDDMCEEEEQLENEVQHNETDRNDPTNDCACCVAEDNLPVRDEMNNLFDTEHQEDHPACCCPSTCICQTPTRCLGDPFCPCRQPTQPPSGSSGNCNNLSIVEYKFDQQSRDQTSENQRAMNNGTHQEQYQKKGDNHTSMLFDALINLYNTRSSENFCECSDSSANTKRWLSFEDEDEEYDDDYSENYCREKNSSDDDDGDEDDEEDSENMEEYQESLLEQYTSLRIELDSQQNNILKIAGQQMSIIYQLQAINKFIITLIKALGNPVCKIMNRGEVMTRYMPVGRFLSIFHVTNYAFGDFMFKFVNKSEDLSQSDYAAITTLLAIIANVTKSNQGRDLFIRNAHARSLVVNLLHALPLFTNFRLELAKKIIIIIFYNICIAPAGLIALQHQSSILNEIQTYIVSDVNYEKKIIGLKFLDLLTRRVFNKKVFDKIEEFVPRHVLCTDSYDEEYNVIRQLSVKVLRNLLHARDRFRTIERNLITSFTEGQHGHIYRYKQCKLAQYYQRDPEYADESGNIIN